jgi:hypothetical protein
MILVVSLVSTSPRQRRLCAPRALRAHVRRVVATAFAFGVAIVLLAPLLLGPAVGPITRALGGEPEHRCACGMVQGQCGCPECARIEHQRQRENAPRPYPVLKSRCGGGDAAVTFAALPLAVPPHVAVLLPAPARDIATPQPPNAPRTHPAEAPPTPPPRAAAV